MSRLAEYLEGEPARKRAAAEAAKAKLDDLEKKLGMTPGGEESRASTSKVNDGGVPEPLAGKKHRFDDTEYLEQSREIVDNVKSAVTAGEALVVSLLCLTFDSFVYVMIGLLKKRKKAKKNHSSESTPNSSEKTTSAIVMDKVVESATSAPIAVAAPVAIAEIGA